MDRNKAISFMHDLLRMMVSKDGSDLFITTGSPPAISWAFRASSRQRKR